MRYSSELIRKAIHFASLAIPAGLFLLPVNVSRTLLLALVLVVLSVDVIRLHEPTVRRLFYFLVGRILREHERFNLLGSTYLLISSLICIWAFSKEVAVLAISFLVVGDTMAALVGRRFGRIRILDKSLEGSLACFFSCVAIGWIYPGPDVTWPMVLVGSFVATVFELMPIPLDDNMRIPLAAGFAMTLVH
jgi:dolichol kinase